MAERRPLVLVSGVTQELPSGDTVAGCPVKGQSADITVTVGSGGDYSTINAALAALSAYYPQYVAGGLSATVNLLTGYSVAEQLHVNGIDLGWITITGVDASTAVASSAFSNGEPAWEDDGEYYVPFIFIEAGGIGPKIKQPFTTTADVESILNMGAYIVSGSALTMEGAGFDSGFFAWNVVVDECSVFIANGCSFTASETEGDCIYIVTSSFASISNSTVTTTDGNGIEFEAGCVGYVGEVTGSCTTGGTGLRCKNSFVACFGSEFSGFGRGCSAEFNGVLFLNSTSTPSYGQYGVYSTGGGKLTGETCNFTSNGSTTNANDCVISSGSLVTLVDTTSGTSTTTNTLTSAGVIFA